MLRTPTVNPRFVLQAIEADRVLLSHETGIRVLDGRLAASIFPLIDGRRTTGDLVRALDGAATPGQVWLNLALLEDEGYFEDATPGEPPGQAAFRSLWGVAPRTFAHRLASKTVTVRAVGSLPVDPLPSMLESMGVRLCANGDLTIVLTDDYLRQELHEIDRRQQRRGRSWLPVKPVGSVIWFGPLMRRNSRPCWRCLCDRLIANRPEVEWLERQGKDIGCEAGRPSIAQLPATHQAALALAATQIVRWIARGAGHPLAARLITLDLSSLRAERHEVIPLAGCRTCHGAAARRRAPRRMTVGRGLTLSRDNGYRSVAPEDTIARLRPIISPITGVIGRLECRTPGASLEHFYVADHVFPPTLLPKEAAHAGFRHLSGGKGMTETQAKASALCEAVERHSGVFRGDEPLRRGRLADVPGAIHPHCCLNFSARQYRNRRRAPGAAHTFVPAPFDDRAVIQWAPAWSLTAQVWRHLPAAYCYYGHRDAGVPEFCRPDSNGCAAGNTREEAILQGFLELIERDAVALWWYNCVRRPGVALETFPGTYFRLLVRRYRALGRDVRVLDLTTDFGLPTFIALSQHVPATDTGLIAGAGTHFDPVVAALRALTEMNQFLPGARAGRLEPRLRVARRDASFLRPDPAQPARRFQDFPRAPAEDVGILVRRCVALADACGLETLVLDQTRGDIGLPVVRVVVPGLRHFYPRLGRGRLYDVPVAIGWLDRRRTEDQLNRVPFFL